MLLGGQDCTDDVGSNASGSSSDCNSDHDKGCVKIDDGILLLVRNGMLRLAFLTLIVLWMEWMELYILFLLHCEGVFDE
jgi:hypothetical protein